MHTWSLSIPYLVLLICKELIILYDFFCKAKSSGSPSRNSQYQWTQVKPRRSETNQEGGKNSRGGGTVNHRGPSWRHDSREGGPAGNRTGNQGGRNRGKGSNMNYSRSVSDNTSNRGSRRNVGNGEHTSRKSSSEGGAFNRWYSRTCI